MNKVFSLILILSFISNTVLADCSPSVTLHVGDTVTDCTRIGLSVDTDKKVRADLVEGDSNKKIIEEQKKIIELKDVSINLSNEQSTLWKNEATRNREDLDKERGRTKFEFWIGIVGGIALTALGAWSIKQVGK